MARTRIDHRSASGFSLLELLLALGLGLLLSTLMLQALLAHGSTSERLVRLLRERTLQRRTLELIRGELLLAERVELGATGSILASCSLGGRRPLLRLTARHISPETLMRQRAAADRGAEFVIVAAAQSG